jgi:hypothetical protein
MITARVLCATPEDRDPAKSNYVEVALPIGFRRVFSGAVKPGDRFLDMTPPQPGEMVGVPVWKLADGGHLRGVADHYACLIRPDQYPVEEVCERCKCQVRVEGHRFCADCCGIVIETKGRA